MTQLIRGSLQLDVSLSSKSYSILNNNYVLVIDTETTTDIKQSAKILMYSVFNLKDASNNPNNIEYLDRGIVIYDLSENETSLLKQYCIKNNLRLLDKESFITGIFYPLIANGTMLAGHNIQFDIGAIAEKFEVNTEGKYFRFKLCTCGNNNTIYCNEHPTIIIQPLKSKKSFMYFEHNDYGAIVDTITLGNSLLGNGKSSLDNMIKRYGHTDKSKLEIDHSYYMFNEYDETFFNYSMHDVYLTSMLVASEYKLYLQHDIKKPFYTIMSEASIGKAYKQKWGETGFTNTHTELPKFMYDRANACYYGGRSEVYIRMIPTEILYCDFKSQYPLVNALLDTQTYLLAEYLKVEHCVEETQEFLNNITIDDLKHKEIWKRLSVLVKVEINNGIVPMRQQINSKLKVYGQTIVNTPIIVWYTLADLVASKLRTGITPIVIDAYKLSAIGNIATNKIKILGDKNYEVDLSKEDFFIRVIDLRDKIKSDLKEVEKQIENEINLLTNSDIENLYESQNYLNNLQTALKLISNSTAYGMLVETREIDRLDVVANFNAMPLGVHITSGAKLLIAIAEKLGLQRNLTHVFCDTDSFAYARPHDMSRELFYNTVQEIILWFDTLSSYQSKDSIFELEKVNFADKKYEYEDEYTIDNKKFTPLYALCVSTKRYVLYNKLTNGQYLIRKMSEHGIPYFLVDNTIEINDITKFENNIDNDIDDILDNDTDNEDEYIDNVINENDMNKFKYDRYLLWYRGIQLAEKNIYPHLKKENWNMQYAITQTTISTPRMYNAYKHITGIRPFSFFCVTPKSIYKERKYRYYMPFIINSSKINILLEHGKIRNIITNEVVTTIDSDTIYDRLKDFYNHPENKADNGSEIGIMKRRTVQNNRIEKRLRSGKKIVESNQLEINW